MSDPEQTLGGLKVNDRRRFDMNGNPRTPEEGQAPSPAQAQPAQGEPQAKREDPEGEVLRLELEAARRRVDELARALQALERDKEDFKQRLARERDRMLEVERGRVAEVLLEALDDLELCLRAADQSSPLAQGVRLIRDGLLAKVQATGVERLEVVGQPFDPNLAEAVDMEITPEADDDQRVVEELRAGYRLKDRVIRPARVKVAKYVQPARA
jgi:molecular chaperone GrpE